MALEGIMNRLILSVFKLQTRCNRVVPHILRQLEVP